MKRFILFFLLIFQISYSYSQSWKEHLDRFYAEITAGDYSKAAETGTELLSKMEKDSVFADVEFYLANTYAALQDFDKAIFHAQSEANIRAKLQGRTNGYYLNAVYYLASYLSTVGRYVEAIDLYLEVYVEMKKQYPGSDNTIAMAQSLADMCYNAGVTKKAQELYEDSWEWIRSSVSPSDSVYINMSYVLGDFYIQNGQPEKSIPFFIMERDRQEKVYGKKSAEYMTAQNALGEICIISGQYAKAKEIYTEFLSLSESFYGKKSADYATALNNLAVTYEKQNEFAEAEKLYLKSLAIKEKVYKKESDYYALTLSNLGVAYDAMGNYAKAEEVLNEAISIYEKIYSGDNVNYANALNNIASLYTSSGKYEKAIEVILRSMEMNKKVNGEASPGYIMSLNSLASIYQSKGDYDQAEKYYLEVLPLYESVLGKSHTDYGVVLFSLANVNFAKGKYSEALQYIEESLVIQEASVGKTHDNYAKSLQTKASILTELGQTRKAEEMFVEAGKIMKELYGELHTSYAIYLNNYGYFLFLKGDFQHSEESLSTALKIQNDALGKSHPENISLLGNLGNVQIQKKDFKSAEENLLSALQIAKTNYQPDQPEYSNVLNNLATLYYQLGNYDKAEPYYLEAMQSRKKFYGEKHAEYATSLNNLGTLYLTKAGASNDYKNVLSLSEKSISYFKDALMIDSLYYGADAPDYSSHLNNLAEAYRISNEPDYAETLFLKSIALNEERLGKDHADLAISYHNLGLLYSGLEQYKKAEENLSKSISIFEKNYGKNSSAGNDALLGLAYVYEKSGKNEKAKESYITALENQKKILEQNFSFLSESEKESYIQTLSITNDAFNTYALNSKIKDPSITTYLYNNEIYNKGLLFRSSSRVKDIILESKDVDLVSNYTEWMDTRQELSVLYSTPESDRIKDIHTVEEKANSLEKQIIQKSENLKNALDISQADWKAVKGKLKTGQAALEFIHFTKNDTLRQDTYCVLVLTPNSSQPEMIELFYSYQLTDIIGKNSGTTYESVSSLYGKQKALNVNLFSLIWGPLEKSLTGITEIYYSPTGLLHKVSFSSIGDANGRFVSDKYILHQLNSTASLVDLTSVKIEPTESLMAMIGGVKFDTDNSAQHVWSYLPGTLTEAEHIQSSLVKAGMKTEMFTAELASEENLKKMDGEKSPDILHVATHGFFFGDPNEQKEIIEKEVSEVKFRGESRGVKTLVENPNPLMRSGIVLAGANDVWNESRPGVKNDKEDGILTAYEVSLMNLQNTKLVVLSACETGLGDIKGAEGVYGLQRAFRIAGVDKMIMSLWQVPDKETDEFMTAFYNELIKTKEIRKAFTNAQKMMRAKYDPYFWGAFVLIE